MSDHQQPGAPVVQGPGSPAAARSAGIGTSAARTAWFVLGKATGMVVVLLVVSALTYAVFVLLPADPAQLACGRPCTPERLEAARGYMGLDQPAWKQYLLFLGGIFAGRTFGPARPPSSARPRASGTPSASTSR